MSRSLFRYKPSKDMRIAILGASSGIGAAAVSLVTDDEFLGSTFGGAIGAIASNMLLGFDGVVKVALLGSLAGYAGKLVASRLVPELAEDEDVPFRAFLGLTLGSSAAALSFNGLFPPEFKLEG